MTRDSVLDAFVKGYEASKKKQQLSAALADFRKTLPKRKRRYFKKP